MARWSLLVVTDDSMQPVALTTGRPFTVGSDEGNALRLGGSRVGSVHCSLGIRDQQLRLELMKGQPGTLLNGIPLSGPTLLHDGDEVSLGDARLLILRSKDEVAAAVRTISWDECVERLNEEVKRAGPLRHVALALIEMPSLNASARQALSRRVRDEVAKMHDFAAISEFSTEVLAVLLSEVPSQSVDRFHARLSQVAGARARTVVAVSSEQAFSGEHVLLNAIESLWPLANPREFTSHHPFLLRMSEALGAALHRGGSVLVRGAVGSGRSALAHHAAQLAGLADAQRPLIVSDVDRLTPEALKSLQARSEKHERFHWFTASARFEWPKVKRVVDLPSLQSRGDDVLSLAELEIARLRTALGRSRLSLTAEAREALVAWHWPGELRELWNVLNRAAHAAMGDEVGSEVFPSRMTSASMMLPLPDARESSEKRLLLEALARTRWNVSAAAVRLGVPRRTLVYRMAKLKMKRPARSAQ